MGIPDFKNVNMSVRPQRVVTFISKDDEYWRHTAIRLIECYSMMWGGAYNLIVPTDGHTISEEFWAILERYNPDYLYFYNSTLLDVKLADPKRYEKIIGERELPLSKQCPDMNGSVGEESVKRQDRLKKTHHFRISDSLKKELDHRLSPFDSGDQVVGPGFSVNGGVDFPLTQIEDIIQYTERKKIVYFDLESRFKNPSLRLLLYSHVGKVGEEYLGRLVDVGFKHIVQAPDEYYRQCLQKDPLEGTVDLREDGLLPTPFSLSMVNLGKYYKIEEHKGHKEPVVLILGDTIEDFCFYYCLSRMHDDFHWLPLSFLKKYTKAREKKRDTDKSLTELESIPVHVMDSVYKGVKHGLSKKDIVLTSISLEADELDERKAELPETYWHLAQGPLDVAEGSIEKPIERIKVSKKFRDFLSCSRYVFEKNNYSNQQTLTFVDGESIGPLETPKPKNFSFVDPAKHRWITEVSIEGYHLPRLHSLGHEVVLERKGDVRISSEGLSYFCPNIGYFGGDIDNTLVRPKLKLVDPLEIFKHYFREAGYNHVELSDKGRYAHETTMKFGSLDKLGDFLTKEKNLNLLDKSLPEKTSACHGKAGEVVCIKDRNYLDFAAIESALGEGTEAIRLIDELIRQDIFYRGYIFQCKRCLNCDWYGVEEITDEFICKRCSAGQQYRYENWKSPNEPRWYYKLDEVVFQGYKANMHVPLLTLYKLKLGSKSFLYVHELELKKDESQENPDIEIDICCIPDGQIVIGESKIDSMKQKDISKLLSFLGEFLRQPDKVVFSTFKQKLSPNIERMINESNVRDPILWSQIDLMGNENAG